MAPEVEALIADPSWDDLGLFSTTHFLCGATAMSVSFEGSTELVTVTALLITSVVACDGVDSEKNGTRLSRKFHPIPLMPDDQAGDQKTYDLRIHLEEHALYPNKTIDISNEALISVRSRVLSELQTNPLSTPAKSLSQAPALAAETKVDRVPERRTSSRTKTAPLSEQVSPCKDFSAYKCSSLNCSARRDLPMETKCGSRHCKRRNFHDLCTGYPGRCIGETWYCCVTQSCLKGALSSLTKAPTPSPRAIRAVRVTERPPAPKVDTTTLAPRMVELAERAHTAEISAAVNEERLNTMRAQVDVEKQKTELEKQKGETEKQRVSAATWEARAFGSKALQEQSSEYALSSSRLAERRADLDRDENARRTTELQEFALNMAGKCSAKRSRAADDGSSSSSQSDSSQSNVENETMPPEVESESTAAVSSAGFFAPPRREAWNRDENHKKSEAKKHKHKHKKFTRSGT